MGVQEVRFDSTGGAHEARKQRRDEQAEPGPAAQVAEHTVAVRDPVVPKLLRPDHLHVDAARANVFDRVGDETACCVTRIARVRRRQHRDAHYGAARSSVTPRPTFRASAASSRPTASVGIP